MKIDGELLGFGDFHSAFSSDNVGAADRGYGSEIVGVTVKKPPKPPTNTKTQYHGQVLKKGKGVLVAAIHTTRRAGQTLAKPAPVLSPAASQKVVSLAKSQVGGTLSPKAQAAAAKAAKAIEKLKHANANVAKAKTIVAKHAVNTRNKAKDLGKALVKQKQTSKLARTPMKQRASRMGEFLMSDPVVGALFADDVVGEEVSEMFGEFFDAVGGPDEGQAPTDQPPPDTGAGASGDPELDKTLTQLDSLGPDTNALDAGAAPSDFPKDMAMDKFYSSAEREAMGGIVYDESKGRPNGFAGSWNLFTGATGVDNKYRHLPGVDSAEHWGYVWGSFYDQGPEQGVPYGNDLPSQGWHKLHGSHIVGERSQWWDDVDESEVIGQNSPGGNPKGPNGVMYGPITGNPYLPDFKGMRMDNTGVFFWLPWEAPKWLTDILAAVAKIAADKAKAAEDAKNKADAAQKAKEEADRQAEKAKTDAENAIAEAKAASEEKVAASAEKTKQAAEVTAQAQAETTAQQALVSQQQAETTQFQEEGGQAKEAGALMLSQAKQEQEFMASHPEYMEAAMAQKILGPQGGDEEEEGGGGEEGGGMEGGEPVPGADVMKDQDGEGYPGAGEEER